MDKILFTTKVINLAVPVQPVELIVESDTALRYVVMDYDQADISSQAINLAYRVTLQDSAKFELLIALMHVEHCTIHIELDLQGCASHADAVVLYALSGQQKITINTVQRHHGQNTVSSVVARGIALGQADVYFHGLISLQPGSAKADAKQEHTTIVLGKQVKVVSIPSIEVLHHDVQCCHGAAIGQFQEEQLWYLQSKGCTKNDAYKMLVRSFFAEHLSQFLDASNLLERLCQKIL